jgi:lipopolysaccharide transport system permease protein
MPELWAYRDLLYFLLWRDLKVRYRYVALGATWAILQPLVTAVVLTFFFGRVVGVESEGIAYPLFVLAGLLPWTLFSVSLGEAAMSLTQASNLVTKVYFPRALLPISAALSGLIEFCLGFVVFLGFAMYFHGATPSMALLPFLILAVPVATAGFGFWLSALNVEYRDIRYAVPFFLQLWIFVRPVIYPSSLVAAKLAAHGLPVWLYGLNPMAGLVEGFRWALFGTGTQVWSILPVSLVVIAVVSTTGLFYFRRVEMSFADRV